MKLLEMKNKLALETAQLIFQNNIDVIFIGGTALNTFYTTYRYSEDIDLGYLTENKKKEIEQLLRKQGYDVQKTDFEYRSIITFDGISIKLDVIKYKKKYNGFTTKKIGGTLIRTLQLEEFTLEKLISFFTREEITGMSRDAYDLFSLEQQYHTATSLIDKTKNIIKNEIVSVDYNIRLFESNREQIENLMAPYLRVPIDYNKVLEFLKQIQGVLHE